MKKIVLVLIDSFCGVCVVDLKPKDKSQLTKVYVYQKFYIITFTKWLGSWKKFVCEDVLKLGKPAIDIFNQQYNRRNNTK